MTIKLLYTLLSSLKTKYVVMHGGRDLARESKGDVDICVTKSSLNDFITEFTQALILHHGFVAYKRPNLGDGWTLAGWFLGAEVIESYRLDIYCRPMLSSKLTYPNLYYSEKTDSFLQQSELVNGISVPELNAELRHYIRRKIIKGQFGAEIRHYLSTIAPDLGTTALNEIVPTDFVASYKRFLDTGEIVEQEKQAMRVALIALLKRENRAARVNWWQRLKYFMRPLTLKRAAMIAVIAPDGAGKTTLIDRLISEAEGVFGAVHYFHLRPTILGAYSAHKRLKRGEALGKPHESKAYGKISSVLKYAYLFMDYLLGYYVRVLPLLLKGRLVVFDRYFYDVMVDPKRFRLTEIPALTHLFSKLLPKPDVTFYLCADAHAVRMRKQDLDVEEIGRQNQLFLTLSKIESNIVVIDANRDKESVYMSVLLRFLSLR